MRDIHIVVACSDNNAIGRGNTIPWRCSGDMRNFSRITKTGHKPTLIMGRHTAESIGQPLPGREIIVVTSHSSSSIVGSRVASSFKAALAMVEDDSTIYVCGGAGIYEEAFKQPHLTLHLSRIHTVVEDADTFFPTNWGEHVWNLVQSDCFLEQDTDPDWTYNKYQTWAY